MKKCEYCGKDYKKNDNNIIKSLPEEIKKRLEFIPDCECIEKKMELDFIEREKELDRENKNNRVKKYKDISVVDKKFKEANFNNANLEDRHIRLAKKYSEKFIQGKMDLGLIFFGNPGTGKTFSSACIANDSMEHGKTVLALSLNSYLAKLRKEWGEAEQDVLEHVKNCDLLILDDFGSEHSTDWAIGKVFALIDARYRSNKPMIITTNLNYDENKNCEITEKFSIDGKDRIKDRIKEMCYPVRCTGESKRKVNKEEFIKKLMED